MLPGVLRNRWFAGFIAATGVVGVGGEFRRLALPLLVLDATHSVGAAAALRVVEFLPFILWGPFAGAIVDRLDRRKVLLACNVGEAVSYGAIAMLATRGFELWQLFALAFVAHCFEVTFGIVSDFSVVPSLVGPNELTQANSLYLAVDRGSRSVGPALAGLAIGVAGYSGPFVVTALSFAATALVIFFMPARYKLDAPVAPFSAGALASEIREGFGYVLRHPILRALLVLMFVANLGGAGLQTVLLFHLREEVGLDPATIGLALSFIGLASLTGPLAAPRIARGRPLGHAMLAVIAFGAASTAFAALVTEWRLIVAAVAGRFFAQGAHIVYAFLPRQREIPPRLGGRANGAFRTLVVGANTLSPALLGGIVEVAGTPFAFLAAALLMGSAVAITLASPLREYALAAVEEEPPAAEEEAEIAE